MPFIRVSVSDLRAGDGNGCQVCANDFCAQACCQHTKTHMTCCGKPLCMGCLSKMCCMCRCQPDCEKVISVCCFCKQVSPVSAMEMFFGLKRVKCTDCDHANG